MADVIISDLPVIVTSTPDDFFIINDGNTTTAIISQANLFGSVTSLQTVGFADGDAGSPSISFASDPNVGIYKPAPDSWAVSTNGIQRLVIDDGGRVGINQSSPASWFNGSNNLVVGDPLLGDNGITIASSTTDVGNIAFADGTTGADTRRGLIRYDHTDDHMRFDTASFERMRITEDGFVGIGTPSPDGMLHLSGDTVRMYFTDADDSSSSRFYQSGSTFAIDCDYDDNKDDSSFIIRVDNRTEFVINSDREASISGPTYVYSSVTNTGHVVGQEAFKVGNGAAGSRFAVYPDGSLAIGGQGTYTDYSTLIDGPTGNATFISRVTTGSSSGRGQFLGTCPGTVTASAADAFVARYDGVDKFNVKYDGNATFAGTGAFKNVTAGQADGEGNITVYSPTGQTSWKALRVLNSAGDTQKAAIYSTGLGEFTSVAVNGNINLTGAGSPGPELSTPAANTIALAPDGAVERIRVDESGAIGLSGANYGLDGQVLTSQGPGVAPAWVSVATGIPDISSLPDLP